MSHDQLLCARCQKPVDGYNVAIVERKIFHENCLKCDECSMVIKGRCEVKTGDVPSDKSRTESQSDKKSDDVIRLCCARCSETRMKTSGTCHGCKAIFSWSGNNIRADGKQWHRWCFKCVKCEKVITREYFKDAAKQHQYCSLECRKQHAPPLPPSQSVEAGSIDASMSDGNVSTH